MRTYLRSKIHKATVTEARLDYVGSVTLDVALMQRVGLIEYERVLVVDNTNGERIETYVIEGPAESGVVCMNGAAAHKIQAGHEIILMAFETTDRPPAKPRQILVDENNRYVCDLDPHDPPAAILSSATPRRPLE
ncbi:MAG: aspartate 1-decarboxylase [Planctomycetota bacterium]